MVVRIAGADIVQVSHGGDIDPVTRDRDHHIGKAEAQSLDQVHAARQLGRFLAQQVFAGDAQMNIARQQGRGDLARRQQHHFDIRKAGEAGAIATRADRLFQHQAALGEPSIAIVLEAALGRNSKRQHHAAPALSDFLAASTRSVRMAQPMALTGCLAPSVSSKVS
jgi:hypothetical protein